MLGTMFQPQFRADPRIAGLGLGFHLDDESGHRTVGHSGILSGFLSALLVAPDDGVGVIALRNTGGLDNRGTPAPLAGELLRRALGVAGNMNIRRGQRPGAGYAAGTARSPARSRTYSFERRWACRWGNSWRCP